MFRKKLVTLTTFRKEVVVYSLENTVFTMSTTA